MVRVFFGRTVLDLLWDDPLQGSREVASVTCVLNEKVDLVQLQELALRQGSLSFEVLKHEEQFYLEGRKSRS